MSGTSHLRAGEITSLLKLAADTVEFTDVTARRAHLMQGLCKLVGARSGLVFDLNVENFDGHGFAKPGSAQLINADPIETRLLQNYLYTGDPMDPGVPGLLREHLHVMTTVRRRVVDDGIWYRSRHYEELRRPTGLDDQLYAKVMLPGPKLIGVGFQREAGDSPFGDREIELVELFNTQAAKLYGGDSSPKISAHDKPVDEVAEELPPRLRPVLQRLLVGDAEKQAAMKLGLSPHTVHEYVKALYRHFQVSSRSELLARFVKPVT